MRSGLAVLGLVALAACARTKADVDEPRDLDPIAALAPWNGESTGSPWATDPKLASLPTRPRFVWQASLAATHYEIEIDDSCEPREMWLCEFPSPELKVDVKSNVFVPDQPLPIARTPPVGKRYYWRARGCDEIGSCTPWTQIRYLDIGRSRSDFNGDGFSDALVSACSYDNPAIDEGTVFVYYGSKSGLGKVASLVLDSPNNRASGEFGFSVAAAGDLNGDGFADAVIGAPRTRDLAASGNAYIYYGSAAGLPRTPSLELKSPTPQSMVDYGFAVAGAGDLNGDGLADVVVGAPAADEGRGVAFVYYGSTKGLALEPSMTLANPHHEKRSYFGSDVAFAGDVNGDGFPEVLIGAPRQDLAGRERGLAALYGGSLIGITGHPTAVVSSPQRTDGGKFAHAVALAGDVNDDGFADLIVGTRTEGASLGRAFVYYPVSGSIPDSPSVQLVDPSGEKESLFGEQVVSLGDINGDQHDDVAVSAVGSDHVYVFHGGRGGIPDRPTLAIKNPGGAQQSMQAIGGGFGIAMASPGDINGDGYSDVLIGAPAQLGGKTGGWHYTGAVFAFHGSRTGLGTKPSMTLQSPDEQADALFGCEVGP